MAWKFRLLIELDILSYYWFFFLLKIIVINIYFTIYNWLRIVINKINLYSTCFTTFSIAKIIASKTSFFYFANLYCLG